jgi:hypothetical protein
MPDVRIERYVVSDKLYNRILDILGDIHIDIIVQTEVSHDMASQLTAQILNRIAYQIHTMNSMPTKRGGNGKTDPH